jgi:uncharacterized repeat protein (TIGR03803 family)
MVEKRQLVTYTALTVGVLSALLLIAVRPAQAQTETVLYILPSYIDQAYCQPHLTSDGAGNFYGVAGTASGYGSVFELSPNGSGGWNETTLYNFTGGADGGYPGYSYLIFDRLGNFYGTTYEGGANGAGVVFELSPVGGSWTETVLYNFVGGTDGYPDSGLVTDSAGNLYGTDGAGYEINGSAAVFELSPSRGGWTEQTITIYEGLGNGFSNWAGLTIDGAGNIFGTTNFTAFELSPNGSGGWNSPATAIYTFPSDGPGAAYPEGTLMLDQAGNLYGTTIGGGAKEYGTVYKLTPVTTGKKAGTWTEKILYSFKGGKDGATPWAGVVFDLAGNIYGTTTAGGKYGEGTVFELVAPVGTGSYKEKILWSFNGTDGAGPTGSLILDSGILYGITYSGGSHGEGVVFEVNPSGVATTTTFTSAPNPSTSGESVTFTAVVSPVPPDGETVSFMKGTTVLGTGSLTSGSTTLTTSALAVGTSSVTAVYGGDLNFGPSTSKVLKQVVKK